jgi:hypothetical protein
MSMLNARGTSQTCPGCRQIKPKMLQPKVLQPNTLQPNTLGESAHACDCGVVPLGGLAAAQIVELRANFRPGTGRQTPIAPAWVA